MFNFDDFARVATAAVGALVLSTLSVAAAVGPATPAGASQPVYAALVSRDVPAHG